MPAAWARLWITGWPNLRDCSMKMRSPEANRRSSRLPPPPSDGTVSSCGEMASTCSATCRHADGWKSVPATVLTCESALSVKAAVHPASSLYARHTRAAGFRSLCGKSTPTRKRPGWLATLWAPDSWPCTQWNSATISSSSRFPREDPMKRKVSDRSAPKAAPAAAMASSCTPWIGTHRWWRPNPDALKWASLDCRASLLMSAGAYTMGSLEISAMRSIRCSVRCPSPAPSSMMASLRLLARAPCAISSRRVSSSQSSAAGR
eukprot:scaffold1411_cov125-Isochrysis_galbana.AAC.16